MSKASVKKAIKGLDQEALVEMIMELYSLRKEAKEYLEFWANPDIANETEQVKLKIWKKFFGAEDKPRRKPNFTEIKTLIKNFMSVCHEPDYLGEVTLYYAETILEWLEARRGIGMVSNRKRLNDAVSTARAEIEGVEEEGPMTRRLERLEERVEEFYRHAPSPSPRRRRRWLF